MRGNWIANILPETNSQTTLELRHFVNNGACLFDTGAKAYPIWEEKHREELNTKIYEHYANRQIGFETFGRFKFELNVRMREIMPYYVELYATTQYDYNPIENYSMEEEMIDDTTSESNSKMGNVERFSDTPQGKIENLDKHLTTATKNDGTSESEGKNRNVHTGKRRGNIGVTTSQQMIQSERDIILNIDKLIIDELQDLFLGLY